MEKNEEESYNYLEVDILLIEDNIGDARIIQELLRDVRDFNFVLTHVQSLEEAFERLDSNQYDVILLDLGLPDSLGYDTVKKTRERAKNIPIIILTGSIDERIERIAVRTGIQDYLIKGQIESNPLVKSIYHAIDRNKMVQTIESLAKEVQENEKRLYSIIEKNADGILIVDKHNTIQFANNAAEKLLQGSDGKKELIKSQFKHSIKIGLKKEIQIDGKEDNPRYAEINVAEIPWEGYLVNLITIREITNRKIAEKKIIELASFTSENPSPVIKLNNERIIYVNEAGRDNFKIKKGDQTPSFLKEYVNKSIKSRRVEETELKIDDHYYSLKIKPIDNTDDVNIYALDITERKRANIALNESEIKYRSLIENLDSGISCIDRKGVYTIVNEKAAEIQGGKPGDFIGKTIFEILPKEIAEQENNINLEIFKSGKGIIYEETLVSNIGTKNYFINKQPLLDANGEIVGIQNVLLDITKVKESEREVKILEKTLHEINALIEHAPLPIFLIDKSSKILRANEAAKILFECGDEILNFNILDVFHVESKEKVINHYERDIYDLQIPDTLEAVIETKRGNLVDVEIYSTILKIEENLIIQSFFSDISERKVFERHREQLLDELITSLEFKSRFLATISHELRTPLNAILGFSELLIEESYGTLNPDQEDFLKDILSAGNYLLNLINSILDISKIDAGKFKLHLTSINIIKIINESKNIVSKLLEGKKIEFKIEGISPNDFLLGDELRFKQILFNLISNAIKFTTEGFITLRGIEKKELWEFQIKDTGIGIAEKDCSKIFKEFSRIENDKTREITGIGLGLALTKRLITLHGGEIWFESKPGKGTTFFFTIPKGKNKGK